MLPPSEPSTPSGAPFDNSRLRAAHGIERLRLLFTFWIRYYRMRWRGQLSFKFLTLGLSLLMLALVSIGMTMWVTRQLDGGAAAVNEAGRIRMQAWRLTAVLYGGGHETEVVEEARQMAESFKLLQDGDPMRPLFVPWNEDTHASFEALTQAWQALRPVWSGDLPVEPDMVSPMVDTFVAQVDKLVSAIEQTMTRLTAVLNLFQFLMMGLAVVAAVFTLYVGYLFVIYPLQRLRETQPLDLSTTN